MKFQHGLVTLMSCFVFLSCTHLSKITDRMPSVARCETLPESPRLFEIVRNDSREVVIDLGPFIPYFHLSGNYTYQVLFDKKVVQTELVTTNSYRVTLPIKKTGIYELSLYQDEGSPFWKQKVFVVAGADHMLLDEDKQNLAQQYAPVIKYHNQEKYFPVSLDYMLNEVEVDPKLAEEPFQLTNKRVPKGPFQFFGAKPIDLNVKFKLKDIRKILPFYGHAESVLKSGLADSTQTLLKERYGQNHITVYYSVFENPQYKEIYINYHFFYSYDPKNSTVDKESIASHIFDRESITVVLRSTSRKPLYVFYGAHLANQKMAQIDSVGNIVQKWSSGRVFVNWPELNLIDQHPVAFAALGSHGMYPVQGNFAVMLNDGNIKLLSEPAGGERILFPQSLKDQSQAATQYVYNLQPLKLEAVTSQCENTENFLAFSGSTVDVLGPTNATFPPFTDREADYKNYLDPNAPLFNMKADSIRK